MTIGLYADESIIPIDPRFVEVCEPDSIVVCGCVPDQAVPIGASVRGDLVIVRVAAPWVTQWPIRVTLRLTGVRAGFAGWRFPDRTQAEFDANEAFLKMAKPQ